MDWARGELQRAPSVCIGVLLAIQQQPKALWAGGALARKLG